MPAKKKKGKKEATQRRITRFEKARLLGSRAIQLSMGAKPLVEAEKGSDPIDIALKEFNNDLLPLNTEIND